MSGDGSAAHPWRTLAEVERAGLFATRPSFWDAAIGRMVTPNPDAPIHAGDTVYLLNGDHGALSIKGASGKTLVGYANSDFITIEAAPGQTPVVRGLEIKGGAKWVFRGLTFESINDTGKFATFPGQVPDRALVELLGPHENIILDNNNFLSAPDVSKWSIMDWRRLRMTGIQDVDGTCIAITNNKLRNIGFGIRTQKSEFVLLSGNTIDYFSDDGIDYGSSHALIENNRITNSIEDGDGFHRDAMQGQPYNEDTVVEDVVIRNNTVIRLLDPNLPWPGYLQGIDAFDGIYKSVVVTGNVVVTDAWQGISYYGVHGLLIKNNVLLGDSGKVLPCPGGEIGVCTVDKVIYDHKPLPSIVIHASKAKAPSTDVVIEGNITPGIGVDVTAEGLVVRNNLCVPTGDKCVMGYPVNGAMTWARKPGKVGDHNVIPDFGAAGLFAAYDPVKLKYDFRLKRKNPALAN